MDLEARIREATGATAVRRVERIQSLWAGWGEIARYALDGAGAASVIVKVVRPHERANPRGWGSAVSVARKRRSYEVEARFYEDFAPALAGRCRVPAVLHVSPGLFVLEDLDAAGFAGRAVGAGSLDDARIDACVCWLARFHASFLGRAPSGLWLTGTYWNLATRPDELAEMADGPLKRAAKEIDARLSACPLQTVVHGDAKVANFCFASRGHEASGPGPVAAVDFQYAGGGVGVKDLVYFLGSVLSDHDLERSAEAWLDRYFSVLASECPDGDVEAEWRPLLPLAWADFERFLAGWAPGHWKRNGYAARQTDEALSALQVG